MTPEDVMTTLEPIVRQYWQGDRADGGEITVVRTAQGLLLLTRTGSHLIIQVKHARLELA